MKKIWIRIASIIGFCTSVLLIYKYLERKRVERIIETEEKKRTAEMAGIFRKSARK